MVNLLHTDLLTHGRGVAQWYVHYAYKVQEISRNNRTQIFGKQGRFWVNKFEAELPIGTRNGISQKYN